MKEFGGRISLCPPRKRARGTAPRGLAREDETPGAHVEMRAAVGLIEGRARDVADLQKDETLAHLSRKKLKNAAIARVTLNCSAARYPIIGVELAFPEGEDE